MSGRSHPASALSRIAEPTEALRIFMTAAYASVQPPYRDELFETGERGDWLRTLHDQGEGVVAGRRNGLKESLVGNRVRCRPAACTGPSHRAPLLPYLITYLFLGDDHVTRRDPIVDVLLDLPERIVVVG